MDLTEGDVLRLRQLVIDIDVILHPAPSERGAAILTFDGLVGMLERVSGTVGEIVGMP